MKPKKQRKNSLFFWYILDFVKKKCYNSRVEIYIYIGDFYATDFT